MYRQDGTTTYVKNIKKAAFPLLYNDIGADKTCPNAAGMLLLPNLRKYSLLSK